MSKRRLLQRVRSAVALVFLAMLAGLAATATPAWAHKDHKAKEEATQRAAASGSGQTAAMAHDMARPGHAAMMADARQADRQPPTFAARLADWLGRFHPMLVHFPIAFIPAALFTAIVGRRRPGFSAPVQFLVVTAGATAPFAMLSGWLSGGFALGSDDWMLQNHRWLGTGIGLGALALAAFAIKRPEQSRGGAMIAALSILTAAIFVQGWLGGALVHGADHLEW